MSDLFAYPFFKVDALNQFVAWAIGLFFILILCYSIRSMQGKPRLIAYYGYIVLTALASIVVALANNLVLLLVAWGVLGLTLYLLITMGEEGSSLAAKKAFIIVGGTDALMVLGVGILYYLTQSLQMDAMRVELNNGLAVAAYLCIAVACFAKAGAMPFHSWIPDAARTAPIPVVAYLPASLDKLLGIYLLARISLSIFVMHEAMGIVLMCVGACTIIAAVMMALVQHNLKKLLGYHAVSQVGYMVLGLGTGNAIGIAGGLFHMLNHAVYKSCLFLTAGNVEYRAKTSELDELGGLARLMPLTYICCLIASLSISGIPPFNGFVSKWLIYQGLLSRFSTGQSWWGMLFAVFCLLAAMFGSGLTLASFMKLLHAVFLGQRLEDKKNKGLHEVPLSMWAPCAALAGVCVFFGVFAFVVPLKYFIFPAVSAYQTINASTLPGTWSPLLASGLIIAGLLFGLIVFKMGRFASSVRQDTPFIGGERVGTEGEDAVTGLEFYNTIKEMKFFRAMYKKAERGFFDIYEQGKKASVISKFFQYLHNGVLPTYLVWMLLGMVGLFFVLAR